jgi:predicted CXXCH cytochrome family protein
VKKIHVLMSLVLMLSFAGVSDAIVQPHEFLSGDCIMCHIDEKKAPEQIKSSVTDSCTKCHAKIDRTLGHPVDMYPYKNTVIPVDMPLTDRKVTCLTCHYVHPPEGEVNSTFIRREITGISFCLACHKNDSREHVNMGKAHVQPDKIDITGSFDEMTGRCIECHDMGRYFEWGEARSTCMSKLNHPVGVSYESTSNTRKGSFCPLQALSKEVNLFDGKIGCGTCHNIYSPMRNLLVMSNQQSKLCLQCHFECMGF